jgi:PAS domain S-box-containing protein
LPLLIVLIAIVIVTTWLLGWWYVEQALVRMAGEALALGATDVAGELDRLVSERYNDLRLFSKIFSGRVDRDASLIQAYIKHVPEAYGVYHWIGVIDRTGRVVASSSPALSNANMSQIPWFRDAQFHAAENHGVVYLGGVEAFTTEEGAPDALALSSGIYDSTGEFEGVVASRISVPVLEQSAAKLIRHLQARNSALANIEYQVLDDRGVAYIDSHFLHKGLSNFLSFRLGSVELARKGKTGFTDEYHPRLHTRMVTGYSATQGASETYPFSWTVLVHMPREAIVAPIQSFHFTIGIVGLSIIAPIFVLLAWMQQRLRSEWQVAQVERHRATNAEAQYHLLLQTTDQGIFGLNEQGQCTFLNRAAAEMLGYEAVELLGQEIHHRLHPSAICVEEHCSLLHVRTKGVQQRLVDQVFLRKDGTRLDVECSGFPLFTFMAITERKQRTEALLHYQNRLRSLAAKLRTTEAQVRQSLATELHDHLAQLLALCQIRLGSLQGVVGPSAHARVASIMDLVKEALAYTRQLMADLRPPILGNESDLSVAVRWVAAKLERHGLMINLIDDGKPKPLDPDMLRVVYQSLHELLFNVLKHAETLNADVRVRRFRRYLILQVSDQGIGMRGDVWSSPTPNGGFGLFNMREQIALAGGRMRLRSASGKGTHITLILPLLTKTVATLSNPAA